MVKAIMRAVGSYETQDRDGGEPGVPWARGGGQISVEQYPQHRVEGTICSHRDGHRITKKQRVRAAGTNEGPGPRDK